MPELPEVETIRRVIEPQISGLKIKSTTINRSEVIAYPAADEFRERLTGQTVSGMSRRGKFLIFELKSGEKIILHLRMTGCLLVTPKEYATEKHTHVIFEFDNKRVLRFSDTRRFGRFWLIKNGGTDTYSGIENLGLEPFDERFNAEYLREKLAKRKKAIKECLLDQSVIAGIGNIYSDEILFAARIAPNRAASSLEFEEWQRLAKIIPETLSFFIEKNSITPDEYLESKGKDYRNAPFLKVYGKSDKPCPVCGAALKKSVIGGRSSVYCVVCQPLTK